MNFLFDLYGTLVDIQTDERSDDFWKKICILLKENTDRSEALRRQYESLCEKQKATGREEIDLTEVFRAMLEERELPADDASVWQFAARFRRDSRSRLQLFPEVGEILTGLRSRGAGVYLLSNAQACFTRAELRELGLNVYFDGIILSSEIGYKKPSAEFFRIALSSLGLHPANCIYVGNDRRDDVFGAGRAGMRTVYIPTPQSGNYPKGTYPPPDDAVQTHAELKQLLFDIASGLPSV